MSQSQSRNREPFPFTNQVPKEAQLWRDELSRYNDYVQRQLDNLYDQIEADIVIAKAAALADPGLRVTSSGLVKTTTPPVTLDPIIPITTLAPAATLQATTTNHIKITRPFGTSCVWSIDDGSSHTMVTNTIDIDMGSGTAVLNATTSAAGYLDNTVSESYNDLTV